MVGSGNLLPPVLTGLILDPAVLGQDELPAPMMVRSKMGATDAGVVADESTLLGAFKHIMMVPAYILFCCQPLALEKADNSDTSFHVLSNYQLLYLCV